MFKARGSYLVKFTAPLVEDIPALKPHDIVNRLRSEVGAEASYMKAWRSRANNKKGGAEEIEKSYQHINSLLDNLLIENPESVTAFEVDDKTNLLVHFYAYGHGLKLLNIAGLCLHLTLVTQNQVTRLGGKIWAAAKALHVEEFDKIMEEISNLNEEASIYLSKIPSATWTLSKCPRSRFSHLTSNISESLNSWLCEEHLVEPFDSVINHCRNRIVYQVNESVFEVKSNDDNFRIVDLTLLTCTYKQFQEYQFLCIHTCAAILKACKQPSQFVHTTYYTTTLQNVYKESVQPVDVETCCFDNKTLPPASIKQAGWPRKICLQSRGETAPEDQLTCSKCSEKGHNIRTCSRRNQKK
ncbi:Mutator-like transposase [Gigaspora margarita]|uniref:Mutator-like transposase n=1 Tax=Gigaspora margarita TaxID=4874 RepID=A0A8H4AK71_GIGMA|nr:Mutator-like transposase [Gigaspora margarita]